MSATRFTCANTNCHAEWTATDATTPCPECGSNTTIRAVPVGEAVWRMPDVDGYPTDGSERDEPEPVAARRPSSERGSE